jgi:pimeloyl-ACP methyl ester carboxylesterase
MSLSVDAPILAIETPGDGQLNSRFSDPDNASEEDVTRWQLFHGDDWRDAVLFYWNARNNPDLQAHLTLRPRLSELDLPTLITRGDIDDNVHPLSHAFEWHCAHPQSWMWIAPGAGFSLTQRRSEEFAGLFNQFVSECVVGATATDT